MTDSPTTDTDPTPAHGIDRPTKTHAIDRQLTQMRAKRSVIANNVTNAQADLDWYTAQLDLLDSDIATMEQLLIDMFPEPND